MSSETNLEEQPGDAPHIPYRPKDPKQYRPPIGLIGCGAITGEHLTAYRAAKYNVVALCDIDPKRAAARQKEFFPEAELYEDYRDLLRRDDIEVVDIATHPPDRPPLIENALKARKHVLSQKPFVLDLDAGQELVDTADRLGVKLAVNQNGRWAPHFSYIRNAISGGLLGEIRSAQLTVNWDHTWVAGTKFEKVRQLILYDFAIHWFDIVLCFFQGKSARRLFASTARSPSQNVMPPLMAQVLIEFDDGQALLAFDGDLQFGPEDRTYVSGTKATIRSTGPNYNNQVVTLSAETGARHVELVGQWFSDGFHGTMGELLCAIEEKREPTINAAENLDTLALCFAAVASADRHEPITPGSVRHLGQ